MKFKRQDVINQIQKKWRRMRYIYEFKRNIIIIKLPDRTVATIKIVKGYEYLASKIFTKGFKGVNKYFVISELLKETALNKIPGEYGIMILRYDEFEELHLDIERTCKTEYLEKHVTRSHC